MNIMKFIFFSAVLIILLAACSAGQEETSDTGGMDTVSLTAEQRQLASLKTGQMEYRVVSSVVSCTGEIEVPPQGMASVTAPLGGYIADTDIVPGAYVKKGALLAKLSNPEYIVLQQSYLETLGQLKFAEQDYARQKALVDQHAAAVKKFQESESTYNVLKARLAGLQGQLKMIGVDIRKLEGGTIQQEVSLRAPLTGYVTEVNHHQGQFVEPREVIFHIVDLRDLHLHLNVFEKDIANVAQGQVIRFRPAGGNEDTYRGKVSLVSPKRGEVLRTFDIHGHIDGEHARLKPGMYVEAEIQVSDDSVYAVREEAIVASGNTSYVLTEDQGNYEIVPVDTGARMDGWVEIKNAEALRTKKIVTEGASRLFTALRRN